MARLFCRRCSTAASPGHLVCAVASLKLCYILDVVDCLLLSTFHRRPHKQIRSTCNHCSSLDLKRSHCRRSRLQCRIGYTFHAGQVESQNRTSIQLWFWTPGRLSCKVCVFDLQCLLTKANLFMHYFFKSYILINILNVKLRTHGIWLLLVACDRQRQRPRAELFVCVRY